MKKGSIISLLILFVITISAWILYEEIYNNPDMLLTAYNNLSDEDASLITVSPKDSKVEKIVVSDKIRILINKNYGKRKVYKVTFNHTATELNGNLIVFVALDKETVVGKGFGEK